MGNYIAESDLNISEHFRADSDSLEKYEAALEFRSPSGKVLRLNIPSVSFSTMKVHSIWKEPEITPSSSKTNAVRIEQPVLEKVVFNLQIEAERAAAGGQIFSIDTRP